MPNLPEGYIQVNLALPEKLDEKVRSFQHRQEIPAKVEAYRRLIERGLEAEGKSEAPKP